MPERARSYEVAGLKLTPTTSDELLDVVDEAVRTRRQCVVASQNLHGILVHARDAGVRALHARAQTIVHLDGMPLVLLCRAAGIPATRRHRVTWVDFIDPLFAHAAAAGWRVYYLGSQPHVYARGMSVIRARYPQLALAGRHGFFDDAPGSDDERSIRAQIVAFAPEIVLVGMGMGRQERWVERNLAALEPASILMSGACLEYVAGAVRTPPRWMGRWGLEWAFRFAGDPQRFAARYLLEPWIVAGLLAQRAVLRRAR